LLASSRDDEEKNVMSPSTSLEDRRVDFQARLESFRERSGGTDPQVVIDGDVYDNPARFQRGIDTWTPAGFDQAERQLGAAEDTLVRRLRYQKAWAEHDERRADAGRPLTPDDPEHAEVQRMRAEAAAIAARDNCPSTYAQVAELIAVTRAMLAELQRRG
jgi:hypothetical protein